VTRLATGGGRAAAAPTPGTAPAPETGAVTGAEPVVGRLLAARRVLVAVAHPDDETFGCGSLIAHLADRGAEVAVLCLTLGESGEPTAEALADPRSLGAVREAELRSAADLHGVRQVELGGHLDSGFDGPTPSGALCAVAPEALAARVGEAVDRRRADALVVLDAADGHRDHACVLAAARRAAADRPGLALVLTCLPRSLMRRWVAEMVARDRGGPYASVDPDVLGTPDDDLVELDVSDQLARREAAISLHRSQRSPFEDLSEDLRRAFLATAHLRPG
jgi:LmbE family N-acetylglucosaminyl deacetylase